jgi:hypothetical protein
VAGTVPGRQAVGLTGLRLPPITTASSFAASSRRPGVNPDSHRLTGPRSGNRAAARSSCGRALCPMVDGAPVPERLVYALGGRFGPFGLSEGPPIVGGVVRGAGRVRPDPAAAGAARLGAAGSTERRMKPAGRGAPVVAALPRAEISGRTPSARASVGVRALPCLPRNRPAPTDAPADACAGCPAPWVDGCSADAAPATPNPANTVPSTPGAAEGISVLSPAWPAIDRRSGVADLIRLVAGSAPTAPLLRIPRLASSPATPAPALSPGGSVALPADMAAARPEGTATAAVDAGSGGIRPPVERGAPPGDVPDVVPTEEVPGNDGPSDPGGTGGDGLMGPKGAGLEVAWLERACGAPDVVAATGADTGWLGVGGAVSGPPDAGPVDVREGPPEAGP